MKPLSIQIGPYPAHEAEWITEQVLDCKEQYVLLEQIFRGDITPTEFLYSLQFVAESFHLTFLEQQKELRRDEGNL